MPGFEKSRQLMAEASQYLAGGVSSDFRMGISPTPLVFTRGEGAFLYDVDHNRLIDYYLGMGSMILGHSPAPVIQAVIEQVQRGILYAGQSEIEFRAAQLVCQLVPCAERVRFSSSGSEVVQAAWRVARAATGRSVIIKFEGHYHGWFDNVQWSVTPSLEQAGSADHPNRVAASKGQDQLAGQHTEILPWNNLALLEERLSQGDVAAVIMEPVMCNTSCIFPAEGYLEGVRKACTATGTVLIFDEVITGFRVGTGGIQKWLGVTPDLATFGKAIANGFPVACLAGRADLMDLVATRQVVHSGTYNAQVVGMAATVANLEVLSQPDTFAALEQQGQRLKTGITQACERAGIIARVEGFPQAFHVAFEAPAKFTDYRSSLKHNKPRYIAFTTALLNYGVRALERGMWFLSTAHNEEVIDLTLTAVDEVLAAETSK